MRRAALLAVDGGGSKIDAVLLRRDGTVLGAARVAARRPTWATCHRRGAELVRVHRRRDRRAAAERAGLDPARRAPRRSRRLLPRRRGPARRRPAASSRWAAHDTAGRRARLAQRHVRRPARRDRPVVGGRPSSAGSARTARASRRTAASSRFPAIGPISGDWGGANELGGQALWYAIRSEDGRGPNDGLPNGRAAHFGLRRPSQVMEAIYFDRARRGDGSPSWRPLVFAEAAGGDAVARDLVDRQADEIVADGDHGDPPAPDAEARRRRRARRRRLPQPATPGSSPGSTTGVVAVAPKAHGPAARRTRPSSGRRCSAWTPSARRRPRAPPRARA